jgi:hypothetical protein
MYGLIVFREKFFLLFNKIFFLIQATLAFLRKKFGEAATFAPESRTKLGATYSRVPAKKPPLPVRPTATAPFTHIFKAARQHLSHGNCHSSRPYCLARFPRVG